LAAGSNRQADERQLRRDRHKWVRHQYRGLPQGPGGVKKVEVATGFPLEPGSDCDHCARALFVRKNGGNKGSIMLPESASMKLLEERVRPGILFVAR
jgi:hypothetical protein